MTVKLQQSGFVAKYPLSLRILHWIRALLIFVLLGSGWYMTDLPEDDVVTLSFLYPTHKQFGVLVWLLAVLHLALRWRNSSTLPPTPFDLAPWEKWLSHCIHRLIIAFTLLVPLFGYCMSSSFTQSDGVPFFFISHLPEFLPKNDDAFAVYRALHKYCAYALLGCIGLHIAGALKHGLQDKGGATDVLRRMF
ncbi:cytochrome b [Labrys neptuniae]|uniref:Cytochrome b n=1 Tax=Labrys neptuniae TaxID=376174 RepID=A0ABV3PWE2_9HYPH